MPEPYRAGLGRLAAWSDRQIQALDDALATSAATLEPRPLVASLSPSLEGVDDEAIWEVLTALLSLYSAAESNSLKLVDLSASVAQSPDLKIDIPDQRELLAKRLTQLTRHQSLLITAKAFGVLTANEKSYHRARVVTDIRPVFGEDLGRPAAALIVHMLSIAFHQGHGAERWSVDEVHVALDSKDVRQLSEVLRRAEDKAASLAQTLAGADIQVLTSEPVTGPAGNRDADI